MRITIDKQTLQNTVWMFHDQRCKGDITDRSRLDKLYLTGVSKEEDR